MGLGAVVIVKKAAVRPGWFCDRIIGGLDSV